MRGYPRRNVYKKIIHYLFAALSGNAGFPAMISTYSLIALLVLLYVSTQIYANLLLEEVSSREKGRLVCRERVNKLESEYTALSSRARVSHYCERVLGMVEIGGDEVVRIAVGYKSGGYPGPVARSGEGELAADASRFSWSGASEVVRE